MTFYGKVIGLIIGLAILKLPGAILGLIVGHIFDLNYARDFRKNGGFARFFSSHSDLKQQAIFFHALFSALGHISKADGQVTQEEIRIASALMDQMGLKGDTRKEAQQAFRDGKERDFPLDDMLKDFKQHSHGRRDVMQVFLEILISAAFADGKVSSAEVTVLEKVAIALGFSRKDLHFLLSAFEAERRFRSGSRNRTNNSSHQDQYSRSSAKDNLSDAYQILGITQNVDDKAVKRAYKRQMSMHHPDKLMAKGLPEQALELAKNKTQDIQAAYELIKEKRGF